MIDRPDQHLTQNSRILKFRFSLHVVKDDQPQSMTDQTRISPKILEFLS